MRPVLFAAVCGSLTIVGGLAFADDNGAGAAAPAAPSAPTIELQRMPEGDSANKVVCMQPVHEGMLIRAVDCHTEEAWRRIRLRNQQEIREFQEHLDIQTMP